VELEVLCEGTMNKGNEELAPIIIRDRKLGSSDGSMVRKTEENVIQRKNLRNTVPVLCAVRKTEENVIQRIFFEKQCLYCVQ
jgi:hypothetical protein